MIKESLRTTFCVIQLIFLFTFYFIMCFSAGSVLLAVRFILRPFKQIRYKFTRSIKRYWLSLTISIFQFFFPVPIYVSYEKEIKQKNRTI
ncbi:putative lysophosphatidic acid acyltransferase LPAAT, partial [Pseudoloma neurophilia]